MQAWIRHPAGLIPRTAMADNFEWRAAEKRWAFPDSATHPEIAKYKGDHVDLVIRYILTEYWKDAPSLK